MHTYTDGLDTVAESSWCRGLLALTLATSQVLLLGCSRLCRMQACTSVSCTVWASTEATDVGCVSRVDVPNRHLMCGTV